MKKFVACVVVVSMGALASYSGAATQAGSKKVSRASSGMVRAQDPQSLVTAMFFGKYKAGLERDQVSNPRIVSEVSSTEFQIMFYNCEARKDCATVTFLSGYTLQRQPTLDVINEWNKTNRFGRAYLDRDGEAALAVDVDLDDGGLSRALFLDNLEFWTASLISFEKHIGYRD